MKLMVMSIVRVFVVVVAFPVLASAAGMENSLAEINKLPPGERQKRLVAEAKQEGEVVFYSSDTVQSLNAYKEAFLKHYPDLKVNFWRSGGDRVATRVMTEYRAGKLNVDIVGITVETVAEIDNAGVLSRYASPQREFFPAAYLDKRGHYTPTFLLRTVMAYNAQFVKPEDAPKNFQDLLDPRWKGDITIDLEPTRALMGWIKAWGKEKTERYVKDLVANGTALNRGHTLQTQLLCAGQYKIAVELYVFNIMPVKRKGCPIAAVYAHPVSLSPGQAWAIPVTAPHPHAAALFMDLLLSEEIAHDIARRGLMPTRSGIQQAYEELIEVEKNKDRTVFISPEEAHEMLQSTNAIIKGMLSK